MGVRPVAAATLAILNIERSNMARGPDRHTPPGRVLLLRGDDVMAGAEAARELGADHPCHANRLGRRFTILSV